MTAPTPRPTREQVDAELARVANPYVCSDDLHRLLAAEVRALRTELKRLSDELATTRQMIDADREVHDTVHVDVKAAIVDAGLAPHVCDDDPLPAMVRDALAAASASRVKADAAALFGPGSGPAAGRAASNRPVLIDRDGEEWHWIDGAYHSTSSPCRRDEIAQVWGPITEKPAATPLSPGAPEADR